MDEKILRKLFGDWFEPLHPVLNNPGFKGLMNEVNKEYRNHICFPEQKLVFRAFQECPFKDLRVVILGQDPYPGVARKDLSGNLIDPEPYAQGLAFSTKSQFKPPKSLDIIQKSLDNPTKFGPYLDNDLTRWCKQGVLLLNTSLTVRQGNAGSHAHLWRPFTERVITLICQHKRNVVFMLWGSHAKSFGQFIENTGNHIIEDIHPAATIYNKQLEFDGGFDRCNKLLNNAINW